MGTNLKDMIDNAYGRWTRGQVTDQEGLPEWFVEKESEYWGPFKGQPEVFDQDDFDRTKGIADRPIKKIVEAKARKKRKVESQMKRVEPKVMAIANNSEMNQADRVKAISKLYRGVEPKKRGRVYVVGNRRE